jgi:hypothetical protein
MEYGFGSEQVAFVCKNGEIDSGHNIPEVAFDRVREFVKSAGYKGDIKIPVGPYNQSKYIHVQQSLTLVQILGRVEEIGQIEITDIGIQVVSRNGESRTIATGILNWDTNLHKIARSCRKSYI